MLWRDASFRGYAGHLRIPEALDALTELAVEGLDTAVLCSETVWWRCHRRLVADALLLLHDLPVQRLLPGRVTRYLPTEGARRVDDVLVYDGGGPILTATTCA